MWYSNHRKADRIVKKPEYIYHATDHDFTHPIIDPSASLSKRGLGGDFWGEGMYNTKDTDVHDDYAKKAKHTRKYKLPYGFRLLTNVIPVEEFKDIIDKLNAKFNLGLEIDYTYIHEMTYRDLASTVRVLGDGNLPTSLNNMLYQIGYDGLEYPAYTNFAKPKDKTKVEPNILVWNHDAINNPRKFVRERHLGIEDYDEKNESAKNHRKTTLEALSLISRLQEDELVEIIKNNYQYLGSDNKTLDLSSYQKNIKEQLLNRISYDLNYSTLKFWYNDVVDWDTEEAATVNTIVKIIKNNYQLDYHGVIIDLSFKADWLINVLVNYIYKKIKHSPEELAKAILNDGVYNLHGLDINLEKYSDDLYWDLKGELAGFFKQNPLELENLKANNFKYVYNGVRIDFYDISEFIGY